VCQLGRAVTSVVAAVEECTRCSPDGIGFWIIPIRQKSQMPATKQKKPVSWSYNRYKLYKGKQYTGMAVGRGHKWHYDKGLWIDKKITPEKWLINYEVTKRRKGKAPEGSGAPVGTEYHWYILAHQMVKKLDANSYSTALNGYKFKLAHRRASTGKWNITDKTQRKHLIAILKDFIAELEEEPIEEFVSESTDIMASAKKLVAAGNGKAAKKKAAKPVKVRKPELEEA
jgi:hypothetical protein